MGRFAATLCGAAAIAAAVSACAPPDDADVSGTQAIHLTGDAMGFEPAPPPLHVLPAPPVPVTASEAHCSLSNDHGMWEAPLPGTVLVRTGGDLRIECRKPGYRPKRETVRCTSPESGLACGYPAAPIRIVLWADERIDEPW